jgi:hypothetical protein
MNPYEATLPNIASRISAWVRGLLRLYRRPLLIVAGTAMLIAAGFGAAFVPALSPAIAVTATPR